MPLSCQKPLSIHKASAYVVKQYIRLLNRHVCATQTGKSDAIDISTLKRHACVDMCFADVLLCIIYLWLVHTVARYGKMATLKGARVGKTYSLRHTLTCRKSTGNQTPGSATFTLRHVFSIAAKQTTRRRQLRKADPDISQESTIWTFSEHNSPY